jgi:hypothetical protein
MLRHRAVRAHSLMTGAALAAGPCLVVACLTQRPHKYLIGSYGVSEG